MRIVGMAFVILIFSMSMSFVTYSGIFTASSYYESEYESRYSDDLPANLTGITEEQHYPTTMNVLGVIFSGVTFTWIAGYAPPSLQEGITVMILVFDAVIVAFLIGVALVELFTKRSDVLE